MRWRGASSLYAFTLVKKFMFAKLVLGNSCMDWVIPTYAVWKISATSKVDNYKKYGSQSSAVSDCCNLIFD